jgi:hypothetical protein
VSIVFLNPLVSFVGALGQAALVEAVVLAVDAALEAVQMVEAMRA